MTALATSFIQDANFIEVLYIIAFGLFIYGLMGLTGPRTAVRGNRIAAVGHGRRDRRDAAHAQRFGNWGLIIIGIAIGTAIGIPAARNVKMTAMPQMVALFNGVGGGAVALIAWVEFRSRAASPTTRSTWRSSLAVRGDRRLGLVLGLEHRVRQAAGDPPGPADQAARPAVHQRRAAARLRRLRDRDRRRRRTRRRCSSSASSSPRRCSGNFVVLPIGGADMPVVISLLNAFTGL